MVTDEDIVLAKKVAWSVGSRWSAVELDDLRSELILWLYEHVEKVDEYRTEEEKLILALKRHATRYAIREQEARAGGLLEHDAPYTVEQIARGLPFIWEDVPERVVTDPNGRVAKVNSADLGLAQAVLTDLRIVYGDASEDDQDLLALRFRDGISYREIGLVNGISDVAAKKRVVRALVRLRDGLGGVNAYA